MRSSALLILIAFVGVAFWYVTNNYTIEGLHEIRLKKRDATGGTGGTMMAAPPIQRTGDTIRIASFNIQSFGTAKLDKPAVVTILARIVRKFDVIAIQEIRSRDQDVLPRFIDHVNAAGRHYDYVIGPRIGRTTSKEQYAFVFDRASVEVDRGQLYTVDDPDDILHREPFVGWFRVRGPPPDQAFTFSLVNIHIDPDETQAELSALDDVFRVVRDDGRNEDDVILLGDLNVDDANLGDLGAVPGLNWVISGIPTNTRGSHHFDNVVFHQEATDEYVGRGGTFDFMREFNLTIDEALEVSDHLPIWAEFSVYEGGTIGRVATRQTIQARTGAGR
jgi:endonuclease/exonuclease/phosphatase family metal-dependent hydrolase